MRKSANPSRAGIKAKPHYGLENAQAGPRERVRLFGLIPIGAPDEETGPVTRQRRAELMAAMHFLDNSWSVLGGSTFDAQGSMSNVPDQSELLARLRARVHLMRISILLTMSDNTQTSQIDEAFIGFRDIDKTYYPALLKRAEYLAATDRQLDAIDLLQGLLDAPNPLIAGHPDVVLLSVGLKIDQLKLGLSGSVNEVDYHRLGKFAASAQVELARFDV